MLEELKKLDEEYAVPADFKGKVMKQIVSLEQEEKAPIGHDRKVVRYRKYVVTSLASAAVILIACFIAIKGGRMNTGSKSSMMDTVNGKYQTGASVFETNVSEINDMSDVEESVLDVESVSRKYEDAVGFYDNKSFMLESSKMMGDDAEPQSEYVYGEEKRSIADANAVKQLDTINQSSKDLFEYMDETIQFFSLKDIVMDELEECKIEVLEESDDYIVVHGSLEDVQQIIVDIEDLSENEKDTIRLERVGEDSTRVAF